MEAKATPLLTPYKMGQLSLAHRVVHAPVTRCRSLGGLVQAHNLLYYAQRAAPGVLLIAEASVVSDLETSPPASRDASGMIQQQPTSAAGNRLWFWLADDKLLDSTRKTTKLERTDASNKPIPDASHVPRELSRRLTSRINQTAYGNNSNIDVGKQNETHSPLLYVPGLWTHEQVEAWKPVVDAVHAKGALFFCQIWHPASASPTVQGEESRSRPETKEMNSLNDFRIAAKNAMKAGFDGVEIHAANGYLLDKLRKDGANNGISIEESCRFTVEVISTVAQEIGAEHTGVRLSPFADYMDCGASDLKEALALGVIRAMNDLGVLYCHVIEPRCVDSSKEGKLKIPHSLLPFRRAFKGTFMVNGGYDREEGDKAVADGYADLVSYGRLFLANPDLPERFKKKAALNDYDRSSFYTTDPVVGYTDYPFLEQPLATA